MKACCAPDSGRLMPPQCTRFLCLAVCLVLLVFGAGGCWLRGELLPDVPRVPARLTGHVLFTRKDGLEVLDLSTSRLDTLATPPPGTRITSGRWSPSGDQIAYAVSPQEVGARTQSTVFVANNDGSAARSVVVAQSNAEFFQWPTWSPDGASLYALKVDRGGARIERIDVARGDGQVVVDRAGDFDVSRDGSLLAFTRNTDAGGTLSLVRLDDTRETRTLTSTRPFQTIGGPRFSPDGRSVLFSLARAPEVEASAEASFRLAQALGIRRAFAHGLPQDIYSISIESGSGESGSGEGGTPRLLVRIGADDPVATWSPDATRFAVLSVASLGIARTGEPLTPVLAPGGYGSVDWAP